MARTGKIRFSTLDEKSLRDTLKKFNAKIQLIRDNNPKISSIQPREVNVNAVIAEAKKGTREGYKEIMRHYSAYLEEGAEAPDVTAAGVVTTKYQVSEMERQVRNINAYKTANRVKAEKNASPYKGTMGRTRDVETKNIKDKTQLIGERDFFEYAKSLEQRLMRFKNREYDDIYKQNYLKAIKAVFGEKSRLYGMVSDISAQDLANLYYKDVALSINFSYPAVGTSGTTDEEEYILNRFAEYGYEIPDTADSFVL